MITITLTYRNRELRIVERCLDSLKAQTLTTFEVFLVDYGSAPSFSEGLVKLIKNYSFVRLIYCPVTQQLWNKSKAINIALKQANGTSFFVGDIDMLYRNDFIEILYFLREKNDVTYFQVGFLTKEESLKQKPYKAYQLKHLSGEEATGMTLYPTSL